MIRWLKFQYPSLHSIEKIAFLVGLCLAYAIIVKKGACKKNKCLTPRSPTFLRIYPVTPEIRRVHGN